MSVTLKYPHTEDSELVLKFVMPTNFLIRKQKGIICVTHPWCSWIPYDLVFSQPWILMWSFWI